MKNPNRKKLALLILPITMLVYWHLAVATGDNTSDPAPCNEETVPITIGVDWIKMKNYNSRGPCAPPGNYSWNPQFAVQNGPNTNDKTKGIVQVTIELQDATQCKLSKSYITRQWYNSPGRYDLIAEFPKKDVKVIVEYFERCDYCGPQSNGYSTAKFKSETLVSHTQVYNTNTIECNVPEFVGSFQSNCK